MKIEVERVDGYDSEGPCTPSSPTKFIDVEQTKDTIPQIPMSPFFKVGSPVSFLDTNGTIQSIQPLRNSREVKMHERKIIPYPS